MKSAFIKLHISILLAGFTGIFGKLITLNEGLLVLYRLWLSGLLLLIILFFSKRLKVLPVKDFMKIGFAGFLLGLHWIFFYGSIKYANISVGVVCFSLAGFFTALVAPILNKTKVAVAELLLSGLTILGIILIFSFDVQYRTGIILGIISSFIIAFYTIINKRLTKVFNSETITLYQLLGGGISISLLMPLYIYFFPVSSLLPSLRDLIYLLLLSLFCTILLYMLMIQAMKYISPFTVNLSFNLEPVYTIIMAIIFYKESRELTPAFYCGLALIILSVVLQMIRIIKEQNNQVHITNSKI